MNKHNVISLRELEKAKKKAHQKALATGEEESEILAHTVVRTKHPIKRTVIFCFGLASLYFCAISAIEASWFLALVLLGFSGMLFYVSIRGDRCELNECILDTGDVALEVLSEGVGGVLDI